MPGSINDGQQVFTVQEVITQPHQHQKVYTTVTKTHHKTVAAAKDHSQNVAGTNDYSQNVAGTNDYSQNVIGVNDYSQNVTGANDYSQNAIGANNHTEELKETDGYEEYTEKAAASAKRPFYKNKKYWILCSIITIIVIVVVVLLILFVAFPKIAQSTINHSGIDVKQAQISFDAPADANSNLDANSTFYMHMVSDLKNTGPFSANLEFEDNIKVIYNNTELGTINLPKTHVSGGYGTIDTITPFIITNVAAFTEFSRYMMANEKFTWTLDGKAKITALTRTAKVNLKKDITLEGMNGFPEVKIKSFQLPGDSPEGGILIELGTVLTSPSAIGVQLGTLEMDIGYDGVNLGAVKAENVNLQKGKNEILLKGVMKSQANDPAAQTKVSTLFSNYIAGVISNTTATGVSAAPNGKDPITWLSESLKSITLHVALGADKPLSIINSVSMGYLDLKFNKENPYSPSVSAPAVNAGFSMPFGFGLNITEVTQNITLGLNSSSGFTQFAVMNVPYTAATSDQKAGTLQFAIANSQIVGISGKESVYDEYTYGLTAGSNYTFLVAGNATTKVNTTIGPLTLSGINFEVPTQLHGLEFLNSSATVINSLDVVGGQPDHLELSINVTMENPSDFIIATGDVSFNMLSGGTVLGTVILPNLVLARGSNALVATTNFDPKSSDIGQNLLSTFVMGQDNSVHIGGKSDSTPIASLAKGLSDVSIETVLPGLSTALIQGSSLTVRSTSPSDGVVGVKVSIANPFSAGLNIHKVSSAVTYKGMPVGNIDQDISSNPFVISGKSTAQSNDLDMTMNVEPVAIAFLLRSLALDSQLDTRPLDALFSLGGFSVEGQENVEADPSLFNNFNISNYVVEAMKSLKVDLALSSGLTIGQYDNTLSFSQSNVQTATDDSITLLIPIVGQAIVQQIVDASVLSFDSIILSAPTESSFKVQMKGCITNTGPMSAVISFPTPLTVSWQGKTLGQVTMPSLNAEPSVGATFDVSGDFTIANGKDMAAFSAYMINNPDFVWDITSSDVSVSAIGFTFSKIDMHKIVTLAGANGYKNAVQITGFDLPSNDPAGGITLKAKTNIKNSAQVGFNFEGVSFETYYKGVDLGPLSSEAVAVFPPQGVADLSMAGRLIYQQNEEGIATITEVFTNFLSSKSTNLTVKGVSASGPNGVVSWLSEAFKTISIDNVVLPGPATVPELITGINMTNLQIDFTGKNPFAPPAGSTEVRAQLHSPFGFPMAVTSLNMNVDANSGGHNVANLAIPESPSTTSADGIVHTAFNGVPFKVYSGAEALFTQFVAGLTLYPAVPFGLKGTANSLAQTAVGNLKLNNITFDVQTSLAGFNSFGGKTEIISLKVIGGYSTYIDIELEIGLNNPSQITISAGDLKFDVVMNSSGSSVGTVTLPNAIIKPGSNIMTASMKMTSTDLVSLSTLLTQYLTGKTTALTVLGNADSTAITPLKPGLSQLKLATDLQGIPASLVVETQMKFVGLTPNIWVKFYNPLNTPYTVHKVDATAYFTNPKTNEYTKLGVLSGAFSSPVTVPAKSTVISDSPLIMNPELASAIAFLILPNEMKKVDLKQTVTVTVGSGFNGMLYYEQNSVPVVDREPNGMASALSQILQMLNPPSSSAAPASSESSNENVSQTTSTENTS